MGNETTLNQTNQIKITKTKPPTPYWEVWALWWSTGDFLCCLTIDFMHGLRVKLHQTFKLKVLVSLHVCIPFRLEGVFQWKYWLNPGPWVLLLFSLLPCSQTELGTNMSHPSILYLLNSGNLLAPVLLIWLFRCILRNNKFDLVISQNPLVLLQLNSRWPVLL